MTITVISQRKDEETLTANRKSGNGGKWVAGVILVLLALSITFIVLYVELLNKDPNEGKMDRSIEVCLRPECAVAAASLVKAMNRDVNPCDDFYEFACGKWNKSDPMPDDKSRWQVFDVLDRDLSRNLRDSLSVKPAVSAGNTASAADKIRYYFQICTDTEKLQNDTNDALRRHLSEFGLNLESWPFLDDPSGPTDISAILTAVTVARKYGNSLGALNNYILPDPQNPRKNVLNFDVASFTIGRSNYVNDSKTEIQGAYRQFGVDVTLLFVRRMNSTAVERRAEVETFFDGVLAFERNLMKNTKDPVDLRDPTKLQNLYTIRNFSALLWEDETVTEFWVDYFQTAYPEAASTISSETIVNVHQPEFIQYFSRLLKSTLFANEEDGIRFFANYVGWKILESYVNHLDSEFQAVYTRFQEKLRGAATQPPRWETCVNRVNSHLPNAVGSMYVQNYFRQEAKTELEVMIGYLLQSFKEIIKESYWMDEETRIKALEKANQFTNLIAYDDYLMNKTSTQVDEEHANFTVKETYFATFLSGQLFAVAAEGKQLIRDTKPTDWITGAAVVNAFYMPDYNSISFPAGILQPPFLGYGYPQFWNFAAIGTVIGHEITHGFDDQGSRTNGAGILENWWSEASNASFVERAEGIIYQYSQYRYLGFQLNGKANQGENIADNGGLKESFRAYKAYRAEKLKGKEEPRLPGFETFSTEQMFYLSYSQIWCGDYRTQAMELQLNRAHSPGRYRVIGPLQNSEDFAEAYRCAPDTYMNPVKKYAVW